MYAGRTPPGGGHGPGPPPSRPRSAGPASPQSEKGPQSENGPQSDDGTGPGPLELTLYPDVVTDVDDGAGRWQYERGRVNNHGMHVGAYASTSHLAAAGTRDPATLTLTIFFLGSTPPETVTVHGAHDAGSDSEAGTVSAASAGHASRVGNRFRRTGDVVTID